MPNTLAHLGINGFLIRTLIKKSDLLLIYIGSVIPDIPWIIQRIIHTLQLNINTYELRAYSIVMASFFFSIILSFTLAILLENTKRVFFIFSLGSLIHLMLDSLEVKWGNGVHFFAPFNWDLLNLGYFWPESIITYTITFLGFVYLIFNWKVTVSGINIIFIKNNKNLLVFAFCIIAYFFLPLLFMNSVELADNHFIKTLKDKEHRIGKYFESDRGQFIDSKNGDKFVTQFDEELKVTNLDLTSSESMSVRAKFISNDEIQIIEYHIHHYRDLFSYTGLLIITIMLVWSIIKSTNSKLKN